MIQARQDCGATVVLVCTDRRQHPERVIEVLERAGGAGGRWSEQFGSAKAAHDGTLSELLSLGAVPNSKLIERDGTLDSRHRGGVRNTRHGTEVVCPRCYRRYPFRGARFHRGLDAAVAAGMGHIDLSELRRG
ncbi:MAG: hypothetical protein ACRD0H_16865 [Actinomycetes bacterium]